MKQIFEVSSLFKVSSLEEPFRDPHGAGKATLLPFCSKNPLPGRVCVRSPRPTNARPKPQTSPPGGVASCDVPIVSGPTWLQKWSFFGAVLRGSQDAPKMPPRSAQDAPRAPQDAPRGAQDALRCPQEAPKTPQERSKTPQEAPQTFPRAAPGLPSGCS